MEYKELFDNLRAVRLAREQGRIHMVMNVRIFEQLSTLQGGSEPAVTPPAAPREIWTSRKAGASR